MDVRHLTLLRELAERRSVAAVAEATHRTPSAVSQQLRTAERALGVRLVEPEGRGIRLTDAGRLLAEAAVDVEATLEAVQARLDEFRGRPVGTVRIAALASAAEFLLPALTRELAAQGIDLELTDIDVSESDFSRVAADHDVVIGHSLAGPVPAGADTLAHEVLAREPIDIALPARHPLARKDILSPRDVVGETWISVPPGFPFATLLEAVERSAGRQARVVQRLRDNRLVRAYVATGAGIAMLPRFTTVVDEEVVLRPLRGVNSRRWVVAMSRPDRAQRAVVRRTVARLREIGAAAERGRA
jgi:DNA-binding transcriptional LysR family regulator